MIDFLVIGGGIAGLSAGARLSAHGKVTLLERETALGYHASGRSAALFEEQYGLPSVVALNQASADYHRAANGGYLSPRGLMLVAGRGQADTFAKDVKTLSLDPISPEAAMARVPILAPKTLTQAAYHDGACDIDTDRMLQDFAREIRTNGGQVITGAPVRQITRTARGWDVSTEEVFSARVLVNAAGAWADEIAQLAGAAPIGLQPMRRSMARIAAPDGHDVSGWPMIMGVGESWYAKPDAGALLVSPAEEEPVPPQDIWADDMVLAEGFARYQELVRPQVTRPLATWAGLRSFAPDRALVLGPDPDTPEFIWCAGQGGYGFQTAPAASQLLADLVTGASSALSARIIASLTPDRFR